MKAKRRTRPAATAALRISTARERLQAVVREHDTLLARVARRRAVRDQLEAELRGAMTEVAGRLEPLIDQAREVDREIHTRFEALLGQRRRPRDEQEAIRRVYRGLQGRVISVRAPRGDGPRGARPAEPWCPEPPPDVEAPSASRPSDRDALRALFRRLAELIHPDKVQDEADKLARTEAMKQVNVAYAQGDFARLLQLERQWANATSPVDDEDDGARRRETLEAAIGELKTQLRAIERDLRHLRRSPEAELAADSRRGAGDAMTRQAEDELAQLRAVRDFVEAFQQGAITLDRFVAGPGADDDDDDGEVEIDLDDLSDAQLAELADAVAAMFGDPPGRAAAPRPRSRRRSR